MYRRAGSIREPAPQRTHSTARPDHEPVSNPNGHPGEKWIDFVLIKPIDAAKIGPIVCCGAEEERAVARVVAELALATGRWTSALDVKLHRPWAVDTANGTPPGRRGRALQIIVRTNMQSTRPVFLDLRRIKLPISGYVSILHRVSGVLMVLAIPAASILLHQALSGPAGYAASAAFLDHLLVQLALLVLLWSLLHHVFAGIRYLLLDLGIGLDRSAARQSAWVALIAGLAATVLVLGTGASA